MSANLRVRDLAAELGLTNKDIIQSCRELGIQVKSHMSGLSEEEAQQVREAQSQAQSQTDVVRKEVQPGVIVRRRGSRRRKERKAEEAEEAQETLQEPEASVEEPEEAAAPEPEQSPEEAPKSPEPPAKEERAARIISTPSQEPEPDAETQAEAPEAPEEPAVEASAPEAQAESEPSVSEQPQATPPEPAVEKKVMAEPEAAEPVRPPEDSADAKSPDKEPPVAKTEEAAPAAEPEKAAAPAADAEERPKKKKRKRPEHDSQPQVRVIHKPEAPAPSEPRQPSAPEARRPAPSEARRPGRQLRLHAPAAENNGGPAPADDDGRGKKRRKDRRVVEFPRNEQQDQADRRGKRKSEPQERPMRSRGGKRKKGRGGYQDEQEVAQATTQPIKAAKRKIRIEDTVRLSDLAHQMGVKAQEIIKTLFSMGVMATINQSLDLDTATLVSSEFGYEVENVAFTEENFLLPKEEDSPDQLLPRPPVVTIMGHVDHGKTSLLDAIRSTNITAGEAGGITQHIGAYHVQTARGEIVFLDTPGHEAFTTMRARGAQVTDLVVLVVAADDGVMEQTKEAINHARAANVPLLVAVNKIDKEDANPDRVKRELAERGLTPEDWGGETIFAYVSAKQRQGIDELLELILLQAEVLELKANPNKLARGHIVEAKLDKGRGPVGTVLIQEGSLEVGQSFVCGLYHGRVRSMFDDQGAKIEKAGPSIPVEVQGFDGIPEAGDEFVVVEDDKVARRIAETRRLKQREKDLAGKSKVTLESFLASKPEEEAKVLNLVLKADVQGSLEAIQEALVKLSTDAVRVEIIHGGAGAITESDILLASASEAIIIGFNVRPTLKVKELADEENVEVRFYDVIYKLVSEIKDAMSGMLSPLIEEVYLGQAEVRDTFSVPKVGTVAGCFVTDGKLTRNAPVRLLRDGVVLYTGAIDSLKRFKDDAKEVVKGYECGVGLQNFNDIKTGDVIEAFEHKEVAQTLD
ncbi:MAG: translation initiation factor [Desulfovibrionales bacterium]|nr:translation initiation factor [Desulfovibrionales bacterium]